MLKLSTIILSSSYLLIYLNHEFLYSEATYDFLELACLIFHHPDLLMLKIF